jgi:L-ascorbate metabolism protein UlaG (beta-lactamase superfamily)
MKIIFVILVVLVLIAGCGKAEPENYPPVISDIADQVIVEGEMFSRIFFADCVSDADNSDDEITWSHSGSVELEVSDVDQGVLVRIPDADWNGSETIQFEACDPGGLCDAAEVVFMVMPENDPPVVHDDIVDQLILVGETFAPIALDGYVSDVDHSLRAIRWGYSGNTDLEVNIVDRVATVTTPDATWSGSETIRFEGCDPAGSCDATDVVFTVTAEPSVLITYVFNAGFLISSGGKKILVDALFDHCSYGPCSPSRIRLLENGLPPFDNIDLILATHDHYDHFDPLMVGKHLENDPQAVFVSTEDVVSMLRSDFPGFDGVQERVKAIQLTYGESAQVALNGIELEIVRLPHSGANNLGFLIHLAGGRVFHAGDSEGTLSDYQPYQLPGKEIDVAIVTHYQLMGDPNPILEGIQARYIVPMHFPPGDMGDVFNLLEDYFPQVVLFREEMQSWVLPH